MKPDKYERHYPLYRGWSMAKCVDATPHLLKQLESLRVVEWKLHPPFNDITGYKIAKCGKVWVLLGQVPVNFTYQCAEIAFGIDKYELAVWRDLNCPSPPSDAMLS